MITLNLVSDAIKKEIKLRRAYFVISKASFYFTVSIVFISVIFWLAKVWMHNDIMMIQDRIEVLKKNSQAHNVQIRQINGLIRNAENAQKENLEWICIVQGIFSSSSTKEIRFDSFSVDTKNKRFAVRGYAPTRQALLDSWDYFNNLPILEKADLPISLQLMKENIDFEYSTKLKVEGLNNF